MNKSLSTVRTGEITTAVRSMTYKGIEVKMGQVIGIMDGELAVAEYDRLQAVQNLLNKLRAQDSDILTVYYGNNIDGADAESLFDPIRAQYSDLEIETIFGGQPHCDYLLSLE